MTEAAKHGYSAGHPEWANLGQGAPETGNLPDAPERITSISFDTNELEYAPIDGIKELREAVANLYNERYRKNFKSKYTKENVAISAGGRAGITRLVSTIGRTNVGHFLPDYTAYEELLDTFGTFVPIPVLLGPEEGYEFSKEALRREILGRGLSAILLSNPCNPTGRLIAGEELTTWVSQARELSCAILFDEFYSHYTYGQHKAPVSAAAYVEDVDSDPIVIIDGLTKNWRYPGFRVSWTVGPRSIIEAIGSAGSFLDGGCARPMQKAALTVVTPEIADREASAIRNAFSTKRERMLKALSELNITVNPAPEGGFYCWGNLKALPEGLNTGMDFFRKALEAKVIVVPGQFFDIDPGHRRPGRPSRFTHYARFSFGPSLDEVERGLSSLKKLIQSHK